MSRIFYCMLLIMYLKNIYYNNLNYINTIIAIIIQTFNKNKNKIKSGVE